MKLLCRESLLFRKTARGFTGTRQFEVVEIFHEIAFAKRSVLNREISSPARHLKGDTSALDMIKLTSGRLVSFELRYVVGLS